MLQFIHLLFLFKLMSNKKFLNVQLITDYKIFVLNCIIGKENLKKCNGIALLQ